MNYFLQKAVHRSLAACAAGLLLLALACRSTGSHVQDSTTRELWVTGTPDLSLPGLGQKRKDWLDRVTYRRAEDAPVLPAPGNEMLRFVISMPISMTDTGHTGLGVGNDFYDLGPAAGWQYKTLGWDWAALTTPLIFGDSAPWWKRWDRVKWPDYIRSNDDITYNAVISNLPLLVDNRTVLVIPMEVSAAHAEAIRSWWKAIYASPPPYKIPGMQCTAATIKAFETSDPNYAAGTLPIHHIWFPELTSPAVFAAKLLDDSPFSWNTFLRYEQRAGPNQGRPLKALVAKVGDELAAVSYAPDNLPSLSTLLIPLDAARGAETPKSPDDKDEL